ncbi:type II toxin-antitoxin system RelE/ParE family toxin [Rugamonas sp.]|uniref:type II toxin-antitoxin system RelE/ParE family toxin n=1 Tax=Rugamonas sp. TaxID=1926287 RepID=UPI0025DAADCC|nr:type II toxin-antitoxin system RelE/ParE family toxin [Rugamonas sp.]
MKEILTTEVFDQWFNTLKDPAAQDRIQIRIERARWGNFGDHRSMGKGVTEMRIPYGPGYRIYYTVRGTRLVILLAGGNKSTQFNDIRMAQDLARQF